MNNNRKDSIIEQDNYNQERSNTMYSPKLTPRRSVSQEQQLLDLHQRVKKKGIKKQLLLVSALNFFTFICVVFAMAFYQWIWVQLKFDNVFDSQTHCFWVNLIYMKKDIQGSSYQSFTSVKQHICHNISCEAVIEGFRFSGYLCFSIFIIAACIQMIDFSRMIYYVLSLGSIYQTKGNFRHIVLLGTYYIGLSLSAFTATLIQNKQINFGISFWLCLAVLSMFAAVLIYGQFSVKKMVKQALIQNLLDKQKNLRNQQIMQTQSKLIQQDQQEQGYQRKVTL